MEILSITQGSTIVQTQVSLYVGPADSSQLVNQIIEQEINFYFVDLENYLASLPEKGLIAFLAAINGIIQQYVDILGTPTLYYPLPLNSDQLQAIASINPGQALLYVPLPPLKSVSDFQ